MFIIYRQTKQPKTQFTSEDAYRGPACAYAGVEPGQVYQDRKEAEVDASWLFRSSSSNYTVEQVK
jgi:hypothetical protein